MERLLEFKKESRYVEKLLDLYIKANVWEDKWNLLMFHSKDINKEVYAIANYYYKKSEGTNENELKQILLNLLSVVSYKDEIYFAENEKVLRLCHRRSILHRRNTETDGPGWSRIGNKGIP